VRPEPLAAWQYWVPVLAFIEAFPQPGAGMEQPGLSLLSVRIRGLTPILSAYRAVCKSTGWCVAQVLFAQTRSPKAWRTVHISF